MNQPQSRFQSDRLETASRLASGVAHEYNNVLTGIIGYTKEALRELEDDSRAARDLREVLVLARRAAGVTRQLLFLSQQYEMRVELVDLGALVTGVTAALKSTVGERVDLACVVAPGLPPCRVDPAQLEQVLLTLATNASDAMPDGGRLEVTVEATTLADVRQVTTGRLRPGRHVVLTVSDSGTGMEAATRERAFEPFFTTKDIGQGTGLGLSVVHGVITWHGGAIQLDSAPARGTTVAMYLPVAD